MRKTKKASRLSPKESEGFEYNTTASFSFQAKEPERFLTVTCNEREKKRLLTSGFNPAFWRDKSYSFAFPLDLTQGGL